MEKLSIREASQRFGLSRARLYQLLGKGAVAGYLSTMRGPGAGSWIDVDSLRLHIEQRKDKQRERGRQIGLQMGPKMGPKMGPRMGRVVGLLKPMPDGDYLPVRLAAQKSGYTTQHVNSLVRKGSIVAKKAKYGWLIFYPSLLNYINKKFNKKKNLTTITNNV